MRLGKRHHSGRHLGMDMMPMIDVTLLLLFFFMTVSQVQNLDDAPVDLPKLAGTKDRVEGSMVVNVDRDGRFLVEGNELTGPQLAVWTGDEIARRGGDPETFKVTIRGDAEAAARSVNEVVRSLNRLGVTQVRMAVAPGEIRRP